MTRLIYRARVALVRLAKVIPFFLCALVALSFAETLFSLLSDDFVMWSGYIVPHKPLSWIVGEICEYDLQTWAIIVVMSIAMETCVYNRRACAYLGINLFEKRIFTFEMELTTIIFIIIANVIVASYIVYKGAETLKRR